MTSVSEGNDRIRTVFLIGRLYRSSRAELSHCGSDLDTERRTFSDYVLLNASGRMVEAVFSLELGDSK